MKKILTLFAALVLLAVGAAAQKLSYQAVVRNSANELVYDATVSVSLKILAADGVTVQYAETQTATTNQNGLLTLIIGENPTGTYSLANVTWTDASIRTDITLPSGDVVSNTMPVTAVPYALYADGAGGNFNQVQSNWAETDATSSAYILNKPNVPTAVSQLANDANYITLTQVPAQVNADWNATSGAAEILNKPNIPTVPTNVSAFDNDANYITLTQVPAQVNADWNATSGAAEILNKPNIPTVPTNVSAFDNDANYVTEAQLQNAGYITGYTETQNLADVTANGNSAGNRQLKNVSDPTDAQDAVTMSYLTAQTDAITASIQQQLDNLANQYQQQLNGIVSGFQHQIDSLGSVISAQQATIDEHQAVIDSIRNSGGGTTPVTPTTFTCGDNLVVGNDSYTTYQYGSQCWMTQNLRKVSYPDIMTACPDGWRLPDNSDWGTLGNNLPSSTVNFGDGDYWTTNGTMPWQDGQGNAFTLMASLASVRSNSVSIFSNGIACEVNDAINCDCWIDAYCVEFRCVRDESGSTTQAPTVTTGSATSVTENAATLNATITNPDNETITSTGFEYIAAGGTAYTTVVASGNANSFTASLTGLTAGTEYTYRAYITYDNNKVYGSERTFTTTAATPTVFTCGDNLIDGNYSYTTHQYGSQCWMTQNLRTVSYPDVLNACPTGWRLPDNNDWGTLGNNLPSSTVNFGDGDYWTSNGTMPWEDGDGNAFTLLVAVAGVRSNSYSIIANGIACEVNDAINCDCKFTDYCLAFRCVRDESGSTTQAPTVTTGSATSVTENAATLNATITNPDNVTVTPTGFEYMAVGGTAYTTVVASGTGSSFTASLTGLTAGSEYTYRAYITYGNNKVYGSDVTFTTTAATPCPTLGDLIGEPSNLLRFPINNYSDSKVNASISGYYVYYNSHDNIWSPYLEITMSGYSNLVNITSDHNFECTIDYNMLQDYAGQVLKIYPFIKLDGCNPNISYCPSASVDLLIPATSTTFTCGTSTVKDHENNEYHTVQIGNQCWLAENMRCETSPSTGTNIVNNSTDVSFTYTGKMAKWYNNNKTAALEAGYGLLYNWNAAVDTFNTAYGETDVNDASNKAVPVTFTGNRKGICPTNWHIPSSEEWTALINYVNNTYTYDNCSSSVAKALASKTGWWNYAMICNPGDQSIYENNDSGFGAIPAGYLGPNSNDVAGQTTYFLNATQHSNSGVDLWYITYSSTNMNSFWAGKSSCGSVRCVRDSE